MIAQLVLWTAVVLIAAGIALEPLWKGRGRWRRWESEEMTDKGMMKCFCGASLIIFRADDPKVVVEHLREDFVRHEIFQIDGLGRSMTDWMINIHQGREEEERGIEDEWLEIGGEG